MLARIGRMEHEEADTLYVCACITPTFVCGMLNMAI